MLETMFGADMPVAARLAIAVVIVIGLIGAAAWMVRRFAAQRLGGARQPRLVVIEAANIDGRRRLVLIRRDNTEHLMMIGGPTDVVIEGNIMRASPPRAAEAPHPPAAVDALPLGESPTRPLQGEPVARPQASRWEPTPRPSEHMLRAELPSQPQQARTPSMPDQHEALDRLAKILGRIPQPDTASEPRAAQRELSDLPWLQREPRTPRWQPTPAPPASPQPPAPAPAHVSSAERAASTQSSSSD